MDVPASSTAKDETIRVKVWARRVWTLELSLVSARAQTWTGKRADRNSSDPVVVHLTSAPSLSVMSGSCPSGRSDRIRPRLYACFYTNNRCQGLAARGSGLLGEGDQARWCGLVLPNGERATDLAPHTAETVPRQKLVHAPGRVRPVVDVRELAIRCRVRFVLLDAYELA